MSSWVHHAENAYAARGWKQPDYDFRCRVCDTPVYEGEGTELGLEIQACSDCTEKRVQQLVAAEKELARVKKLAAIKLREIALASEMTANDLEKKQ